MVFKSLFLAGLAGVSLLLSPVQPVRQDPEPAAADTVQEPVAEAPAVNLEGIKCLVMGEKANASAEHAIAWREGMVYVCCEDCLAAFEKDPQAYATEANHQLVVTGQYEQKHCPFSGGELAEGSTLAVAGVEVGFCCEDCKNKVAAETETGAQAALVFGNEAFEKAFAKKSVAITLDGINCFLMPKKFVSADKAVDYNGGKVFLCCDGCVKRFSKDPAKFAAKANRQLVQTGQFLQTACPISGHPVDSTMTVDAGGVSVGFCCANCMAKAEAASEDERAEMLFGADAFAKGFGQR